MSGQGAARFFIGSRLGLLVRYYRSFSWGGISVASYIADQQTDAKIATVRAEAPTRVADADAEARHRIAELETKTQTRRLDDKQRAAFIALCQSDTGRLRVSYLTGQGTGEVGQLISDILDAAKAAGAEIGGNGQAFAVLRPGISFEINPRNSALAQRLDRLGKSARSSGRSLHELWSGERCASPHRLARQRIPVVLNMLARAHTLYG